MSAGKTDSAPAGTPIVCTAQTVPFPATFSNQPSKLLERAATMASTSPSPSTSVPHTVSAAETPALAIRWSTQAEPLPAVFSYQCTLEPVNAVTSRSTSPSPSTSVPCTNEAPSRAATRCDVHAEPLPAVFSYQSTWSPTYMAASASWSPSLSTSAVDAPSATETPASIGGCTTMGTSRASARDPASAARAANTPAATNGENRTRLVMAPVVQRRPRQTRGQCHSFSTCGSSPGNEPDRDPRSTVRLGRSTGGWRSPRESPASGGRA